MSCSDLFRASRGKINHCFLDTRVKHEYDKVDINSINNVDFNFMNKDIMPLDSRV